MAKSGVSSFSLIETPYPQNPTRKGGRQPALRSENKELLYGSSKSEHSNLSSSSAFPKLSFQKYVVKLDINYYNLITAN
jgi:hypothetical protein